MKTIGMIGGMSWESSLEYYRIVNETVKARLGGLHSAQTLMYSVDFAEIEVLQSEARWDEATAMMIDAARRLERGGADLIIICTNTMHKMADAVQAAVNIPLLHIADATAAQIQRQGLATVGLLGTRYTMEQDFYRGRLEQRHRLRVLVPGADDRATVNRIIYDELVLGDIRVESKAAYVRIMERLIADGAQGIILGCTEIGLLIQQQDCAVPVFDTTTIHAVAAVEAALATITEGS
ncbi:MAG: aspartate/glutamate racemase family protein [Anaerolineae bacterium]|nr:aspartate/glutamate racemase family protein [Anaerolineae bacterium]